MSRVSSNGDVNDRGAPGSPLAASPEEKLEKLVTWRSFPKIGRFFVDRFS